ncbi:MAG: alpha/beta hydrolase, partial [Clostridia bacterium]|nr:alpha/beta hydrolase [Clostridia bacterium]
ELGSNATVTIYVQDYFCEMYTPYPKNAMIICPGSGYKKCAKREAEPLAIKLLSMNFNAFVLTYSCDPVHYPVQLLEVAALYDLINKNNDRWHINTERIGIMGFSAGGHLAAHYSTSYDSLEISKYFELPYRPYATVLGYPVISVDKSILKTSSIENLLGYEPKDDETQKFSCEYLVSENTPPTFIWHTTEDGTVNVENSLRYAVALSKNKIPYTLHIYPYGGHGLSTVDELTNNSLDTKVSYASDWIEQFQKWVRITF